jgi:hypothetical protein
MPRLRPAPREEEEQPKPQLQAVQEEPVAEAVEIEPQVEVAEPKVDDATAALQRQIEELKKSEALQKELLTQANKDREAALSRTRELDTRYLRAEKEARDAEYDSIANALRAATSEADKATQDLENAESLGDAKAKADAVRRLTIAAARITQLEDGKEVLEQQRKEPQRQPEVDVVDTWNLPENTTRLLKNNRNWLVGKSFDALRHFNHVAEAEGHIIHSQPFLDRVTELMHEYESGSKPKPKEEEVDETPKPRERSIVSAPVSRDVPSSDGKPRGKVKLTAQEVEAARVSGITPEEYATQKLKYAEMKANGQYGEQR